MAWFESWFNSPWYHLLYDHRDERDAELFLDALLHKLHPSPESSILDLGCGKGRHSIYLNQKGYSVTGLDLSPESILHCRQFENETLSFFVHDMRHLFRVNDFDFVFNLFTSFGYFDNDKEHESAVVNAAHALKQGGTLIIDFMNAEYVKNNLVASEIIVKSGIEFHIKRVCSNGIFTKEIHFNHQGEEYNFAERVAALSHSDFVRYFEAANLELKTTYGDYQLNPWQPSGSPRMILHAVKKK